jgi:acyl-CoA dehydrogenase
VFKRELFNEDHEAFRDTVRRFIENEIAPHHAKWEDSGVVPRELWLKAGAAGMLCCTVPERYEGAGADYLFDVVVFEEMARSGFTGPGFMIHCDLVATYIASFGTEEEVAAEDGARRSDRLAGNDRTACRLGLESHPHEGRAQR